MLATARPEDGAAAVEAESFIWQIAMSFHQRQGPGPG